MSSQIPTTWSWAAVSKTARSFRRAAHRASFSRCPNLSHTCHRYARYCLATSSSPAHLRGSAPRAPPDISPGRRRASQLGGGCRDAAYPDDQVINPIPTLKITYRRIRIMPLHRLTHVVMGVPNVAEVASYYRDFGLTPTTYDHRFSTVDGGEQLTLVKTARRRLVELGVGADDADDLVRVASRLDKLGISYERTDTTVSAHDRGTEAVVRVEIAERLAQRPAPTPLYNNPGSVARTGARADGILREDRVHPRKLGHVVLGSTDHEGSQRFFIDGLGFRISDSVPDMATFMRCSSDHHNVLLQPTPVAFLHHTSWQVDDVDD